MVRDITLYLALVMVSLNSWPPLGTSSVFAFAVPNSDEDTQAALSSISETERDRAAKEIFLPSKRREEAEIVRTLQEFLPRIPERDGGERFYCSSGEIDKRRLRTSKRRLRESRPFFNENKRRLRFVKRQDVLDDDVDEGGLYPRLRYHDVRRRDASDV